MSSYSNDERLCYICYTMEGNELIRCSVCNIPTHKECLSLFHIDTNNTQKAKYLDSIYHKIRPFPQLSNPHYRSWLEPWICEKCFENLDEKTHCYFCFIRDGLLAKIRFQPADKKAATKKKGNEDKQTNWAHLNCILKLYAKIPQYEEETRSFILEKDILVEAPGCKNCGPPFKMDVKCNNCSKFYAHNLCWSQDKMNIRLCSTCEKADNFTQKMDSNISGNYLHKILTNLSYNGKFNCFGKKKSDKDRSQTDSGIEIVEEKRLTDFYIKENENRQRVFVFPHITKDTFYGDGRFSEPHGKVRNSDLVNRSRPSTNKNKDKLCYEFIIGSEARPEYKLEILVKKDVKRENGSTSDPDAFLNMTNLDEDGRSDVKAEIDVKEEDIKQEAKRDEGEFDAGISIEIPIDKDHAGSNDYEYSNQSLLSKGKKPKMRTLENLADLVKDWYCTSSVQVLKELQKIYLDSYNHKNYQNLQDKIYLTKKWFELLSNLDDKSNSNALKQFDEKMKKEIVDKFELFQRYRLQCDTYPQIPQGYRKYKEIWEYAPAVESESYKQELNASVSSKKTHRCNKDCACSCLEQLGPYLIEKQTWKTECPGRAILHECDHTCGCDLTKCKNTSIARKNRKMLNRDLKETYCWGIDFATHNHILVVLPEIPDFDKNSFIENKLLRAVNLCATPYDMVAACKDIISQAKKGSKFFDEKDCEIAKLLSRAIKFVNTFDPSAFRVYTKGYGVICINENGIPANDLIAEYFGEMYTPWRWFEKQDLIKRYAKEKNKKDELPDFYNIMLERHKDDPDGYDVLFVDPINKGNFSSRFSHSCDPNCGTITTISNGKYCVAMYSLKPISYGEELTFDYYSVTENEKEHKQAVCLCGSKNCRTYYLQLVTSKQQNAYLDKHLCFLKRNWLVYQCNEPLTEEDKQILTQYSFGNAILDGCPTWLKKWAALILHFVQEEKEKYVEFTFPRKKQEMELHYQKKPLDKDVIDQIKKQLEVERYPLESDRIVNLAITLNKIKHVLNLIKEKSQNPGKHEPIVKEKTKYVRDSDGSGAEEEMYSDDEDDAGSDEFNFNNFQSNKKSNKFDREESENSNQKVFNKAMKDIKEILAPFKVISKEEICNNLWDRSNEGNEGERRGKQDKTEGILNEFLEIIEKYDNKKELHKAIDYQKSRTISIISKLDENDFEAKFFYIRKLFLEISNCLKSLPKNSNVDWQGLSDILYFYAFTFTYFTSNNYPSVTSETEATVRACDMPDPQKFIKNKIDEINADDEAHILKGEKKVYNGSYIWGQLAIWWKQTVDKPEASLSQDRRGTLSYPAPSSFVDTNNSTNGSFDYPHGNRANWLKKLIEGPANSWPTFKSQKKTGSWSFKNDLKMYGTFLLDCVVMKNKHPELLEKIIKFIDKPNEKRLQLFDEINKYYHDRIDYILPQNPQDGRDLSIFPHMSTQPIVLTPLITLQQPQSTRGMNFRPPNTYSD